tara:strand:+ start:3991 stop:5139 length:1149 start_codon:yes stop_codon:yes gene_type:complete
MLSFLRISSAYPSFIKKLQNNNLRNLNYNSLIDLYFKENYSVSNNITNELSKLNYECKEVISNFDLSQKLWLKEFGNKRSKDNIIIQQIKFYKPDIVYLGNSELANKEMIDLIRQQDFIKLILSFHCAPFNKKIFRNLKNVDGIVTCTEGYYIKCINEISKNVLLMQHAFPKKIIKDNIKKNINLSFIGSIFLEKNLHYDRVDIIYSLMRKFNNKFIAINFSNKFFLSYFFALFKSIYKFSIFKDFSFFFKILYIYSFARKPIFGKDMYNVLSKTKILINTHIGDTEFAGNMRLFEGTGLGCLVITDKKKGLEKLFNIGDEIDIFLNKEDLIQKCGKYLSDEKLLNKISINGYKKTYNFHNYENRINLLNNFIKKLLNEKNL